MKLKRRTEHYVVYTKQEAEKLLLEDSRVDKVINEPYKLTIKTKPIKLKPEKKEQKALIVCPIGTYTIEMELCKNCRGKKSHIAKVDINRDNGTVSPLSGNDRVGNWHTHHITSHWSNKICWGNAETTYLTLKWNRDWFWLGKLCLELISDSEPEDDGLFTLYNQVVSFLQLKYAIQVKNKVWERKLRHIIFTEFKRVRLKKWLS